jgi:hypothetical protein
MPIKGDSALSRAPLRESAKQAREAKDVGDAIGLTLRVLVVLRKIN